MKSLILPRAIWNKIFEYDSTYHDCYFNLLKEFKEKTSFWRIKWSHKDITLSETYYKYYVQKHNSVLQLIQYFENDTRRFDQRKIAKCTDLFMTDEESNCHIKILNYLKDTKGFIWNKTQKALYKPGKR